MQENISSLKKRAHFFSSQQKAAKIAGAAYLLTTAIVVYANFGINDHLMVAGNPSQTAQNILAHESLFRLGIVCHLFYCAGTLVLLTALYVILRPVSRGLALFAAFSRMLYALVWIFIALKFFTALGLIGGTDYLQVFEKERLEALAKLFLAGSDEYYVGLLFWSLASTMCSWLWFKSNYVPKALAIFGFVSSVWCIACTIAFLIFPGFEQTVNLWWFDSPMAIFELVLSFWLLFKGLRLPIIQ